jgi:hypothetical protein
MMLPRLSQTPTRRSSTVRVVALQASSRRQVLETFGASTVAAGVVLVFSSPDFALADDESSSTSPPAIIYNKKPSAPLEYLLPAARVKRTIDRAARLVSSLSLEVDQADDNNKSADASIITTAMDKLSAVLLTPQNYYLRDRPLTPIPERPAKEYLDTYRRNRERLSVLERPGAMMVESGEISAWKRLKQRERRQEEHDEIRAALNTYTSALNYRSDQYVLNVSSKERSQMIKQDSLPDIKQVIQSDMGLRYLYRNEFLTAVQDATAELEYQISSGDVSLTDLSHALKKAQTACNQWFSLVDDDDLREAMLVVESEEGAP